MNLIKRLLSVFAGIVSGALLTVLITRIKDWNYRKRLLKNVDVFAEPLEERFNEIIDSITVKYDEVKDAFSGFFEQKRTKSVVTDRNMKATSG
jgi:hypothetical protein